MPRKVLGSLGKREIRFSGVEVAERCCTVGRLRDLDHGQQLAFFYVRSNVTVISLDIAGTCIDRRSEMLYVSRKTISPLARLLRVTTDTAVRATCAVSALRFCGRLHGPHARDEYRGNQMKQWSCPTFVKRPSRGLTSCNGMFARRFAYYFGLCNMILPLEFVLSVDSGCAVCRREPAER